MESVFVTENPSDMDLFVNECNEVENRKIGEIFQLKDNTLLMCCIHCSQEFHYFTEFSLHIQEHYLRNDVVQLRKTNDDDAMKSYGEIVPQHFNVQPKQSDRRQTFIGDGDELFDKDLQLMDEWCENNGTSIFEPEINVKLPEPCSFIDGTDYEHLNGTFRCLICTHESTKWELFRNHMMTHSNAPNILCPICSKAFTAVSYVRKHVNRTHKMKITADKIREAQPTFSADYSINRPLEGKSFVEGEDYEKTNGRFKCLTCGREMLDHIKEHLVTHSNTKNIFCPICDKPFIAVSYVRKHVNRAHKMKITADEIKAAQTATNFTDQKVDISGNYVPNNIASMMMANNRVEKVQKNFECFECHRQFTGLSSLRIHLKLHSGTKYECPYCDKLFAMRSYVRDHIVAIHGIKRDEIPKDCIRQATGVLVSGSKANVEWLQCNQCNNRYSKRQTLRQHIAKTHSAGPFLCVKCGAVYKSIANLRYHNEKHEADPNQRHKCLHTLCSKTYPTRRYMLSHYRKIHLKTDGPN